MSDLIAVTGNLTSSPLRHAVSGGVTMVTFGLASTERRFDNGTWTDVHTNFYSVSVFRKLAEHAFASLEKGQRVILSGKLKVRSWEANGKSGTSVDLEATSIGPDLMFGVATFVKDGRGAQSEAPVVDDRASSAPDDWAARVPGEGAPDAVGDTAAAHVENPRAQSDHGSEGARSPELVGAGGGAWATPGAEEETPF